MQGRRHSLLPLSQQYRRAGSSGDQAAMRIDVGIEVVWNRVDRIRRRRARKSNSQESVFIRPPQATSDLVSANLAGIHGDFFVSSSATCFGVMLRLADFV